MALPTNHPLNEHVVWAYMADASAASSAFAVAPVAGKIVKMGSVHYVAITGADNAFTSKIAGTLITGGAWTQVQSGSAAGDAYSAVPTAANVVTEGQNIEFISDGAGSTTCPTMCYAIIRTGAA